MAPSILADLIERRLGNIVELWADRSLAIAAPVSARREDVIDSLREFLGELVRALRANGDLAKRMREMSAVAKGHGRQRFHFGYDVVSLVREYATLRDVLYDLMLEEEVTPAVVELRGLSEFLFLSVADAAGEYARQRDAEVRDRAAAHLAFLAHELRNPLGSARLAFDRMAAAGQLPDSRARHTLDRSLNKLGALIDRELVDARFKVEVKPRVEAVDLRALVGEVLDDSETDADAKGLILAVERDAPLMIDGDPRLLYSALSNLVRNAVKFSRRDGRVVVRLKGGDDAVVVEVEDSCGGLPPNAAAKLFDPFVQLGTDRSGFGLGLAIARQAAEAHDGSVRVHNLPGKGCVFVMELPIERVPPAEPNPASRRRPNEGV